MAGEDSIGPPGLSTLMSLVVPAARSQTKKPPFAVAATTSVPTTAGEVAGVSSGSTIGTDAAANRVSRRRSFPTGPAIRALPGAAKAAPAGQLLQASSAYA